MNNSVSTPSPRYARIRAWLEGDSQLALWLTRPRAELAYVVSGAGAAIRRLAGRLSHEPITDVGAEIDEAFATGHRIGLGRGRREALGRGGFA